MYAVYLMSKVAAYFQTWSSTWVSESDKMDLAQLNGVDIVYLAFAQPDMTYTSGSFNGTGLDFSQDFSVVKGAIDILKKKGVVVMLSVGGGSYWSVPKKFNSGACLALMTDLGCDGIDLDWEVGCSDEKVLTDAIKILRFKNTTCKISFCGWSTGAYGKNGSTFQGMNVDAMENAGGLVDWINVMCYDAGTSFDPRGAISCYRIYYKGPLFMGFEVGNQAWGGALLSTKDVQSNCKWIKAENQQNGIFLWSWQKQNDGITPTGQEVLDIARGIFKSPPIPQPTPDPAPTSKCPYCGHNLTIVLS